MATQRSIKTKDLVVGEKVFVYGKVDYSHITRKYIVGTPEFNEANFRRKQRGIREMDKDYSSITIVDPRVRTADTTAIRYDNGQTIADTSKMNTAEIWAYESIYQSNATGKYTYSHNDKGNLPKVGELDEANKTFNLITPKGELASGLDVILEFKVYKGKFGNGLGLQAVYSRGPIRYYGEGDSSSALEELGFSLGQDLREKEPAQDSTEEPTAPAAPAAPETNQFATPAETQPEDLTGVVDGGSGLPW